MSLDQYHNDPDISSSHMGLEDEDAETAEASVRALRPRSSRRGSWESGESRWSARVGSALLNTGAPSVTSGMTRPSSIGGQSIARSLSINMLKMGQGLVEQDGRKANPGIEENIDRDKDRDPAANERVETSSIEQPIPSPADHEDVAPQPARSTTPVAQRLSQATSN